MHAAGPAFPDNVSLISNAASGRIDGDRGMKSKRCVARTGPFVDEVEAKGMRCLLLLGSGRDQ